MKPLSDLTQIFLQNDATAFFICLAIALVFLQSVKIVWVWGKWILRFVRASVLRFSFVNLLFVVCLGGVVWFGRYKVSDFLQLIETPIYAGQFGSLDDEHQARIFEQELERLNVDSVSKEVERVTVETANALGCPRLWLYACHYSECSFQPFVVRKDRVAASWAQLTTAGLFGIKIDGRQTTLEGDVIPACNQRDIKKVMQFSKTYFLDRWKLYGQKPVSRPVDVYLLLFAPSAIGKPLDYVLYSGYSNPSYYMNAGLDGFTILSSGRIVRQPSQIDGKITVAELGRVQEYKKNQLLEKYLK